MKALGAFKGLTAVSHSIVAEQPISFDLWIALPRGARVLKVGWRRKEQEEEETKEESREAFRGL